MKKRVFTLLLAVLLLGQVSAYAEGGVATAADMAPVEDVVEEGMTPVYAESLREGEYAVVVDSSSSMFRIESCALRVEDGQMTARLTIGSSSYLYLYPGTAEEAAAAAEDDWLTAEIGEDGSHSFYLPVEALDAGIPCAAFSRKKALWYDRTLLFRADSLPLEAFAEGTLVTAESLGLADGVYTVEVSLEGGSGRATVASPTTLTVKDGACTAEILWGSSNYDYMRVGEEQYFPLDSEGNSRFAIPVSAFDTSLAVVADTTAMSKPHEIDYSLRFDAASLRPAEEKADHLALSYAEQFAVDFCEDGSAKLTIAGTERYRILPKGAPLPADLAADEMVLRQPAERVYLASSAAADLFRALDALDQVRLSSTKAENWGIPAMREALESCAILYAGKYSAPDFELLTAEDCDLIVENMMILHAPDIKEKLEKLGFPLLLDRSSNETHPLGRLEWIKLYGLLSGRLEEAEAFFEQQVQTLQAVEAQEKSGKTVAYFHITSQGVAVVHTAEDYVLKMVELAGGRCAELGLAANQAGQSTVNMQMEAFYTAAREADVLIYNSTIDEELSTIEQLLERSPLLADFDAVKNGQVWCMERDMFQQSSAAAEVIAELQQILSGTADDALDFLHRLT